MAVEGFSNLVRDKKTNAILNLDSRAIEEAKLRKKLRSEKREEEEHYKQKIENMQSDISEIKQALDTLLKRNI
jgi:hypothetical protein